MCCSHVLAEDVSGSAGSSVRESCWMSSGSINSLCHLWKTSHICQNRSVEFKEMSGGHASLPRAGTFFSSMHHCVCVCLCGGPAVPTPPQPTDFSWSEAFKDLKQLHYFPVNLRLLLSCSSSSFLPSRHALSLVLSSDLLCSFCLANVHTLCSFSSPLRNQQISSISHLCFINQLLLPHFLFPRLPLLIYSSCTLQHQHPPTERPTALISSLEQPRQHTVMLSCGESSCSRS